MNQFETSAETWKRKMANYLWTAKTLEHQHSDKAEDFCRAAAIARKNWIIAEVLGQ